MISLSFIYPSALWLLLLVPLIIGLALAGPRRPTTGRFWGGLLIRTLLLLFLILALAGIQVRLPANHLTTVFLLDVSDSIPQREQARGEALIREAVSAMPRGDRAAVILFGGDALVERLASMDARLADLTSTPVTARTDIASALQLALALFPNEGAKRMVLLSDGQENVGQAVTQANLAAAHAIEISYVPLSGPQSDIEVLVERLESPATAREGQDFDLMVAIHSTTGVDGTLRVFGDGALVRTESLRLQPGLNRLRVPVDAVEGGFRRFSAQIVPDADSWLQNNEASAFTVVHGPPRVLLVTADEAEAGNLHRALETARIRVQSVAPGALPTSLDALANFEAVILINVPAAALPPGAMEALRVYVRDLGKGLLMTGGENAFGAGGYLRTPLEEALPVEMDVRSREQMPNLALALVVDKSGSMGACHCDDPNGLANYTRVESGQPKVDIAKQAVMQAAAALGPQDDLGVVAFDDAAHWSLEINQLVDLVSLERSIGGLQAAGGTNLEAGVIAAYDGLQSIDARRKHIILLTDGWGQEGQLTTLARQMRDQGITLSVVAAGGGSAPYLTTLAESGGGRFYPATDILTVPDFFLKETVKAVGRYIVEEPFYPLPLASSPMMDGLDVGLLPPLWGYNGATAKATAHTVLGTPQGDPLLVTWHYGLGRAAVWTSDMTGRWGKEWVTWASFARFASQFVGWTLPLPQIEGISARAVMEEDEAVIRVEAADEGGQPRNFLDVTATLIGPDLETREVTLAQVGAGRYEARTFLGQAGTYLVQVGVAADNAPIGQQTLGLIVPYSPEYRQRNTNRALLTDLALRTGGGELPNALAAFVHNLPAVQQAREIWYPLLLLAALLLPLDIAVRRVLLSKAPLQRAQSWLQDRLPTYPTAARQPLVEQLINARDRVRAQRRTKTTGSTVIKAEESAAQSVGSQESAKVTPQQATQSHPPQEEERPSTEADTLTRLRRAKRRARRN